MEVQSTLRLQDVNMPLCKGLPSIYVIKLSHACDYIKRSSHGHAMWNRNRYSKKIKTWSLINQHKGQDVWHPYLELLFTRLQLASRSWVNKYVWRFLVHGFISLSFIWGGWRGGQQVSCCWNNKYTAVVSKLSKSDILTTLHFNVKFRTSYLVHLMLICFLGNLLNNQSS